jgi:DNA repair protein RadA/Sms
MIESSNLSKRNVLKDFPVRTADININEDIKARTGVNELDHVFSGSIAVGSLILFCGSTGIGKSTMLFQLLENYNEVLYIW